MNQYFKDKIAERRDSHSLDSTNGFIQGISVGFEFSCAHLCPHCKGGDVPERIDQKQLGYIVNLRNERCKRWPDHRPQPIDNLMWRHTKRKDKKSRVDITPLCKSSSLREAWRNENV